MTRKAVIVTTKPFLAWAQSVAARARLAKFTTIEYLAEKAFWQAQYICGFDGTLEAWVALVQAEVDKLPPPKRAIVPIKAKVVPPAPTKD